jgi:hypothetical protein
MRHLIYGVLAGFLLAAPAFAQSAPAGSTAKPPATQPAQRSTSSSPPAGQAAKPANTQAQPPKDDSMTNYDVNGSNASDAMGGAP